MPRKIAAKKTAKKPEETNRIQKDVVKTRGPIKYKIELNEEQKEAKRLIYNNQVTIITGKAGTGKSLVAVQAALDMLFKKETPKIYITRPVVEIGQSLGFLPGTFEEKLAPYLVPIIDNLEKIYNEEKIAELMTTKTIDVAPIGYVRGRTFDCILIIDEAQNATLEDLKACLTRLGKNGKIIVTGDVAQCDLKNKRSSGLSYIIDMAHNVPGIGYVDLQENHRSGLVKEMLDYFDANAIEEEKPEAKKRQYLKG